MTDHSLPQPDEMYTAVLERDTRYDGIFFTAVKTTGIFCRPSCPARKPERQNVEFFPSTREALAHGFRPCLRCRPMERPGETPEPIRRLLEEIEQRPMQRLRDADLRARGLEPAMLRRWFRAHHGMTFQAYHRARRLALALGRLADGEPITRAAYDSGYDSLSGFQDALRQITGRSPARSRGTPLVHLTRVLTPIGPMLLGTTAEHVCILEFTDRRMLETQLTRLARRLACAFVPGTTDVARQMMQELEEYFAGTRRVFEAPVRTPGTPFQQRVWQALRAIPYGEVRSYGEQARALGAPHAVRAVARANGDNRVAIVIPCHRVLGADGTLTGYGGGLWRKQWLLEREGWRPRGRAAQPVRAEQQELLS